MASFEPPVFHRSDDVDPTALAGQAVAVIGYGNLGRSMALNLRDAGLAVTVGNVDDGYRARAEADGFLVETVGAATAGADVVYVLVPDEVIPGCFRADIGPALRPGAAVCFASGYCLAYGLISPPAQADVLLLAPRMLGEEVRAAFLDGTGFFSYVSVEQDATGTADTRLLALAAAAGSLQRGVMRLPAAQEALIDLLVEQTVGPYLGAAVQLAFAVGVDAGLPPEAMVLEMYMSGEMARTFQAFADVGFYRSVTGHGAVAQFGGFLRTLEIDQAEMRRQFDTTVEDIRSGGFARRLQAEEEDGYPTLSAISGITAGDDPMSHAEDRVRQALGLDAGA